MEQLMLINPRKRGGTRKPRTAAQRAATKRMVAANRARRSTKRRAVTTYASNPAPARRRARRSVAKIMRSRRRNPAGRSGGVVNMAMGSFMGATGALLVGTVGNYIPLPAAMQTPNMKAVVNGVLAIALGTFGGKVLGRRAVQMAEGALTVTLHDAMKNLLSGVIPMNLGYYSPAMVLGPDNRTGLPAPAEQSLREYMAPLSAREREGLGEYMYR